MLNFLQVLKRNIKSIKNQFYKGLYNNSNQKTYEYSYGKYTYTQELAIYHWGEKAKLKIGAFCSIAKGVKIYLGGNHRVDWVTTYPFNVMWECAKEIKGNPSTKGDVIIGNDVWIGADAVILSGVTIGDGAVIGARAVVSKNIPPYAVAVGNPAKVVRFRFNEEVIEHLLSIKWWDWEDKKIEYFITYLCSPNIENFIKIAITESHDRF